MAQYVTFSLIRGTLQNSDTHGGCCNYLRDDGAALLALADHATTRLYLSITRAVGVSLLCVGVTAEVKHTNLSHVIATAQQSGNVIAKLI